ncbi:ATP-dependent Clp protease adaptor ClpS [Candidatus Sumerlaeota bacterium]|nr:ATP-dependent Clp protease adaptor ClpS [Candidatus Sumerlaeota bacterium]
MRQRLRGVRAKFRPWVLSFMTELSERFAMASAAGSPAHSPAVPEAPAAPVESPGRPKIEYDIGAMEPRREFAVVLYNDDDHDMLSVVRQLMLALECPASRAHALMLEAHNSGRVTVAIASRGRAIRIATILRQIDLRVSIHQVN